MLIAWDQIAPTVFERVTGVPVGGPYDRIQFYRTDAGARMAFASQPYMTYSPGGGPLIAPARSHPSPLDGGAGAGDHGTAASRAAAGFAEEVEQLRQDVGVPGMAISIVENGQVTFDQGLRRPQAGRDGAGRRGDDLPQRSTGKAFTTAALALLVDEGKIAWDDPVIQHMPWFAMYDPWVTREITVRDLLVHRSGLGLGEGDLLLVPRSDRASSACAI